MTLPRPDQPAVDPRSSRSQIFDSRSVMRPDSKQPSAPWAWYTVVVFAEFHDYETTLYSTRMIRTANWKYVYNPATEDELYDLRSDPGELHNLAGMVFALVGQLPGLTLSGLAGWWQPPALLTVSENAPAAPHWLIDLVVPFCFAATVGMVAAALANRKLLYRWIARPLGIQR